VDDRHVAQKRQPGAGGDHLVVGVRDHHCHGARVDRRAGAENIGRRQATSVASSGAQADPAPA
jgi:hypothetical protein